MGSLALTSVVGAERERNEDVAPMPDRARRGPVFSAVKVSALTLSAGEMVLRSRPVGAFAGLMMQAADVLGAVRGPLAGRLP